MNTPFTPFARQSSPAREEALRIILISTYELGRQPLSLAEPTALLRAEGHDVHCIDLSQQRLSPETIEGADIIAICLGMHTATRIAVEALPRIKRMAPGARLCAFGLYAPVNKALLQSLGITTILDSEPEAGLLALARPESGDEAVAQSPAANPRRIPFVVPDRSALPTLDSYARLELPDGTTKTVGFTDTTRGCKHLCRHCPVVPVYQGRFHTIPRDVVLADIRQQIAAGARHISFGDHDFFNGPGHALRIVRALHDEFQEITYDAVIKVQHLLDLAQHLPELKRTGCIFVTTAVESIDDRVLEILQKNHTRRDFLKAVELLRETGIDLAPTFIPFTPWTTAAGYLELLQELVRLKLVESVPPIQLTIRLLVPQGSWLLDVDGFRDLVGAFSPRLLGYPWKNPDPEVDALQQAVYRWVGQSEKKNLPRRAVFEGIWKMAHDVGGREATDLPEDLGRRVPAMSEPWYCCAEPTEQQLQEF